MNFIDKLDESQQQNAIKIARQAKAMGVPPRLAVALAYQESGLRQDQIGAEGEIGIMQIKPTTAELIGFNRDQIKDADSNIKAGLTYLKQGLDRYKDPLLAVAGYNAGMDHPFLSDPSKKLPESTLNYLKSIKSLGGFTQAAAPAEGEEAAPEAEVQPGAEAAPASERGPGTVEVSEEDMMNQLARAAVDVAGAGTGAAVSRKLATGARDADTVAALRQLAASGQVPGGATPGEKWGSKVVGYTKPGAYSVKETAEAYQRAMPRGKVSGPMAKQWGIAGPGEPSSIVDRMIARGQAAQPPGALSRVAGAAMRSPGVSGALGGLGAAEMGMETVQRMQQGDPIGAALAGAGAAGSTMAVIPHPATKIIGGAMGAASPLALYLYDKMRSTSPQAAQQMLSNVDIQGNPMP